MSDETENVPLNPCRGCGIELGYNKAASIEVRGVYDGGLFYAHVIETGGCGFAWHRWGLHPAGYTRLRDKAQPFIDRWNRRYFDADPDRATRQGHSRPGGR